jgi:S1-C subfamily serine protease
MPRPLACTVVLAAITIAAGCAGDPPAAVVGLTVAGCPPGTAHGSGILVEPGLILTSAHVVKGATDIEVTSRGRTTSGTIVGFDPDMDLAYLAVEPDLTAPATVAGERVEEGARGSAYVYRDGEVVVLPVRVRRPVQIHTEDIYIEGDTYRPGYELDAAIQSGDSGGPVMVNGEVVGVIWARSSKFENRAYAINPDEAGETIREQLRTGSIGPDIDLTRCT